MTSTDSKTAPTLAQPVSPRRLLSRSRSNVHTFFTRRLPGTPDTQDDPPASEYLQEDTVQLDPSLTLKTEIHMFERAAAQRQTPGQISIGPPSAASTKRSRPMTSYDSRRKSIYRRVWENSQQPEVDGEDEEHSSTDLKQRAMARLQGPAAQNVARFQQSHVTSPRGHATRLQSHPASSRQLFMSGHRSPCHLRSSGFLSHASLTRGSSDGMDATDASSEAETEVHIPEPNDFLPRETLDKCLWWIDGLPERFSGLSNALAIPDSTPSV